MTFGGLLNVTLPVLMPLTPNPDMEAAQVPGLYGGRWFWVTSTQMLLSCHSSYEAEASMGNTLLQGITVHNCPTETEDNLTKGGQVLEYAHVATGYLILCPF